MTCVLHLGRTGVWVVLCVAVTWMWGGCSSLAPFYLQSTRVVRRFGLPLFVRPCLPFCILLPWIRLTIALLCGCALCRFSCPHSRLGCSTGTCTPASYKECLPLLRRCFFRFVVAPTLPRNSALRSHGCRPVVVLSSRVLNEM